MTYQVNFSGQFNSTIVVPGTSFCISRNYFSLQLQGQETTMAAGDFLQLQTTVEGSSFREISNDVHSVSLLVRSTVANLKFSLMLRDSLAAKSLGKLCTLGAANTWTLVQLPNLPVFPGAGNWSVLREISVIT